MDKKSLNMVETIACVYIGLQCYSVSNLIYDKYIRKPLRNKRKPKYHIYYTD